MPNRHRPTIEIQPLVGDLEAIELLGQLSEHSKHLSGVGLVDLPDVDVRRALLARAPSGSRRRARCP
jgi:hypothetical protein